LEVNVRIGIIGAGHIGGTLARLFVKAGHDVALANSRGPASLQSLVDELGDNAHAMRVNEAAGWGEIVVLAIPWREHAGLPDPDAVRGKIVIDAMNPYRDDGGLFDLGDSTSSEETRKRLPGSVLVKAFNTIFWLHLREQGKPGAPEDERRAIFVAGDDEDAKDSVAKLIDEIGFAPIDTGPLREGGRLQQPGSPIYNRDLTAKDARQLLTTSG
jgi:predicted dinucleotide-binding enzyme